MARVSTTTVRNGVRVKVWRSDGGTAVETTCSCLGLPGKVHSTMSCPNRPKAGA